MKRISTIIVSLLFAANIFAQSELLETYPDPSKVKVKEDFPKEGRNNKPGKAEVLVLI